MNNIEGNCECRKISFEIKQKSTYFSHCHCSQCRRLHAAAYGSYIEVNRSSFTYNSGEDSIKTYASSEHSRRLFCENCGSNIMVIVNAYPDRLFIALGLVNGDPELPEAHHIYVGSKAPWHDINDDLKQYDEEPLEYENP